VKCIKTHVGHEDELRTKRLSQKEQTLIVEQLQEKNSEEDLCIEEPSTSKMNYLKNKGNELISSERTKEVR
jgi:hypothetical protein